MSAGKISPSLMCANCLRLEDDLRVFEENGIEYLHIDIMDGAFVPNFTLGTDFVRIVKRSCKIPLDLHLMITEPERKLDWFDFGEGDIVSVHYESTPHIHRAIQTVKARGAKVMLALNPGTPLSVAESLWPDMDGLLIMTVNPGFAGQKLIPQTLEKIREARRTHPNIEIEADGNVSFVNAKIMREAGADIFVAGTSSVFAGGPIQENINRLREIIQPPYPVFMFAH